MKRKTRQRRVFSEELKRKIVKEIEQGKANIATICREYSVSNVSVYKWLHMYSSYLQKGVKVVLELNSEGYRSKELEKRVKELEAAIGRKQLEVEFLNKLIDIANQELGIDIKKKSFTPPSIGSGSIVKKGHSR
jgi:transposase-like protein